MCIRFFASDVKVYSLMLYHLLKSTLHSKANFYMQSTLYSKANACNIGTFIRFYIQMWVEKKQSICL